MSNKMTVKDRLKTYRKHPGSFLVMLLVMLGALLTFSVLLFLIAYILINGVPHIKLSLFEWNYTSENASVVPAYQYDRNDDTFSFDRSSVRCFFSNLSCGILGKRK